MTNHRPPRKGKFLNPVDVLPFETELLDPVIHGASTFGHGISHRTQFSFKRYSGCRLITSCAYKIIETISNKPSSSLSSFKKKLGNIHKYIRYYENKFKQRINDIKDVSRHFCTYYQMFLRERSFSESTCCSYFDFFR